MIKMNALQFIFLFGCMHLVSWALPVRQIDPLKTAKRSVYLSLEFTVSSVCMFVVANKMSILFFSLFREDTLVHIKWLI